MLYPNACIGDNFSGVFSGFLATRSLLPAASLLPHTPFEQATKSTMPSSSTASASPPRCALWLHMHTFKTGGTTLRHLGKRWADDHRGLYLEGARPPNAAREVTDRDGLTSIDYAACGAAGGKRRVLDPDCTRLSFVHDAPRSQNRSLLARARDAAGDDK